MLTRGRKNPPMPPKNGRDEKSPEKKIGLKEVMDEVRELREDVLVNSWVNVKRIELLEKTVEQLAEALNQVVALLDKVIPIIKPFS